MARAVPPLAFISVWAYCFMGFIIVWALHRLYVIVYFCIVWALYRLYNCTGIVPSVYIYAIFQFEFYGIVGTSIEYGVHGCSLVTAL